MEWNSPCSQAEGQFIIKEQKQAKYKSVSILSKIAIKIRVHTILQYNFSKNFSIHIEGQCNVQMDIKPKAEKLFKMLQIMDTPQ